MTTKKKLTDSVAVTGRPAWSVTCWVDDLWLYVEMPLAEGAPYISKFAKTEGAFAKALAIMSSAHKAAAKPTYKQTAAPTITRRHRGRKVDEFTPAQEATMADLIRRFKGPVH